MAFDAFALMLVMLALGKLFARQRVLPANTTEVLNGVVLYLCLPASVLIYVPRLQFNLELLGLMLTPWLLTGVSALAMLGLRRPLRLRRDQPAGLLLCVALGNSSFIGNPTARAPAGATALPAAAATDP
ncbi:AEC family transporter, partial [Xanthomonas sontii]|uniref:AEC family transporter n=1 Tax=Xanthomonas sontii TaxID=2650745 RepID=UPI002ED87839